MFFFFLKMQQFCLRNRRIVFNSFFKYDGYYFSRIRYFSNFSFRYAKQDSKLRRSLIKFDGGGKVVNEKRWFDLHLKNESGLISPATAFACKRRNFLFRVQQLPAAVVCRTNYTILFLSRVSETRVFREGLRRFSQVKGKVNSR